MDKNDWLKDQMINFIEEHWSAFIQRCEEYGIFEEDIEKEIDEYKNKK